jgi:alginate O-acetyltransferase complex protein AlgI
LWGAVIGLLVVVATMVGPPRLGPDDVPSLRALPAMLGTFLVICLTWVLFRAVDLPHAMGLYAAIFGDLARPSAWAQLAHYGEFLGAFGPLLAMFVIVEWLTRDRLHPLGLRSWPRPLRWLLYTALIWLTIYLMPDDPEAFIYFQF